MNEQLETVMQDARTLAADARSSFGSLSAVQLNWKPSAERWSIAQCFDHLITTNKGFFPVVASVLNGTKKTRFWERLPIDTGHALHWERPENFAADLKTFLNSDLQAFAK